MITITTGTAPTTGELSRIIFSEIYGRAPRIVLSPSNDAASSVDYFIGQ